MVSYGHMGIPPFICDMSREDLKVPNLFKKKGEKPGKYQCYPSTQTDQRLAVLGSQYLDAMSHLYSLKLNINEKQSIKKQLEVPSQLLTLDNSRDSFGRSCLSVTQLKA